MKRYLERTRIARALKAETWQRGSGPAERGKGASGSGGKTGLSGPRGSAAGLALTTSSVGPP